MPSRASSGSSTERRPAKRTCVAADVIVLGGCSAIEQAAKNAENDMTVPFTPGSTDASQEQTDVESFAVLEAAAGGFRNNLDGRRAASAEEFLGLTAPETAVLVGDMRVLDTNLRRSRHDVFTGRTEALINDLFVNLLDMSTT